VITPFAHKYHIPKAAIRDAPVSADYQPFFR